MKPAPIATAVLVVGVVLATSFHAGLSIDDIPRRVRSTVEREVDAGSVQRIVWVHPGDFPRYEVHFTAEGVSWRLEIDETGTVIRRERR